VTYGVCVAVFVNRPLKDRLAGLAGELSGSVAGGGEVVPPPELAAVAGRVSAAGCDAGSFVAPFSLSASLPRPGFAGSMRAGSFFAGCGAA
jgi:hypothetical protein